MKQQSTSMLGHEATVNQLLGHEATVNQLLRHEAAVNQLLRHETAIHQLLRCGFSILAEQDESAVMLSTHSDREPVGRDTEMTIQQYDVPSP
jgi:hypothetical protein